MTSVAADLAGVRVSHAVEGFTAGLVVARGCDAVDAARVDAIVEEALAVARVPGHGDAHAAAVRDLLRHGAYKPTGRGKPASEYLRQAALGGRFPRVMPLVDVANAASLAAALPVSLVDLGRAPSSSFTVRRGRAGERYVFNRAGQELDLHDLLLLAASPDDTPLANAVKDSMATKLDAGARDVLAVTWAPWSLRGEAERTCGVLERWLREACGARDTALALA